MVIRDGLLLLRLTLRAGLLTAGLLWLVHTSLTSLPPQKATPSESVTQHLQRSTGGTRQQVVSCWQELGPAITAELRQGRAVHLPGLGTLRVVNGPASTLIMSPGGPVHTSPRRGVEFVPTSELLQSLQPPERVESWQSFTSTAQ